MPLIHESIAEVLEPELVEHVLNDVHYSSTLFNIEGMRTRDARVLERVELRDFRKTLAGDIDILVIPRDAPEAATAIQVKRFMARVGINEVGEDKVEGGSPQRFRKLMKDGIKQANRMKRVGFAQAYLWVFVVIDAREKNNGWYAYEGADSLLRSQIEQAISPAGLDPTIGLMKFDWVQAMDRPPFELNTHGSSQKRPAKRSSQPPELTEWLRNLRAPVLRPYRRL